MQYSTTASDFMYLRENINTKKLNGSDSALASLFLLQPKYDIELCVENSVLFRKYHGAQNRTGWAFPIPLHSASESYLHSALAFILDQCEKENVTPQFCLCTQEQKNLIDACFTKHFSSCSVSWNTNRDDSDYLYLTQNLATLSGSNYQKKRNHISRFNRIYGDDWTFKTFPEHDIADDIMFVADTWFNEKDGPENEALILEHESIQIALENAQLLQIRGGVVYIHGKPAAMTLASPISDIVLDVHFEKAIAEHEPNGVFAIVNNQFAKTCTDFLYLNREEDMGVEGLRKAKLSYKPTTVLDKFYGKVM